MSEKQHVDLALDGTQMFQRFIAKKTVEQRELKFEALDRAYVGFVTGLDDKWVRITETDPELAEKRMMAVLINLANVSTVTETGRGITELTSKEAEQVRAYTGVFRKASRGELTPRPQGAA